MDALARLTDLTYLMLAFCENLEDVSSLAALKNLSYLSLQGCRKVTDLTPLAGLKNLRTLILVDAGAPNVSALKGMGGLYIYRG